MLGAEQAEGAAELLGVDLLLLGEPRDDLVDVQAVDLLVIRLEDVQQVDIRRQHVRGLVQRLDGHVLRAPPPPSARSVCHFDWRADESASAHHHGGPDVLHERFDHVGGGHGHSPGFVQPRGRDAVERVERMPFRVQREGGQPGGLELILDSVDRRSQHGEQG